jgi:hypothetical protein
MTFYFGILAEIDIAVSTLAMTLTILFLTGFDVLTRVIEYSVRNNLIYNKMLQKMYKELMTMGFVTLLVTLYTAANPTGVFARYSTEIDFVGYVTFFVAIFFVAHALYIMILSMRTSKLYGHLHRIKVAKAIEIFTQSQKNCWQKFLFEIPYLPFSSVRQKLEFKIIHSLFRDTYWLPTDFDYGSYLSRSFEKYSLKMINIGWTSWVIMIILGFLNYLRVQFLSSVDSLSCTRLGGDYNATDRRLFINDGQDIGGIDTPVDDMYSSGNMQIDKDNLVNELNDRFLREISQSCIQLNVIIFIISGSVVVIYAFFLFMTGRFYYERLIERTGISCLSDYPKFLMFEESISLKISSNQRQQQQRQLEIEINNNYSKKSKRRMSINTLRKNVNVLLKEPQLKEEEKVFNKISQSIDNTMKRRRSVVKKAMSSVNKKVVCPMKENKAVSAFMSMRALRSLKSFGSMKSLLDDDSESKLEKRPTIPKTADGDEEEDTNTALTHEPLIYRKDSSSSSNVRQTLKVLSRQSSNLKQKSMKNLNSSLKRGFSGSEKDKLKTNPALRRRNMIINIQKDNNGALDSGSQDVDSLTSIEQFKLFKLKERDEKSIKQSEKKNKGMMMSYLRHHNNTFDRQSENLNMKLSEDLSDIYFFENPDLYFKAVEYAIMLNSLYLSLWACNFISVVQSNFDNAWIYQIFMLVPLLFVLPLLGEIVKVSSLLEAIADLDIDVIGAVLEEMEEKNSLVLELRQKILSRIVGEMDDKKQIVKRLFQEIDTDKNGLISMLEMRQMLRALTLHYSDAKFLRLYNAIDDDLNGSINELELTLLIFPDMTEDDDIKQRRRNLRQTSRDIDSRRASVKFRPRLFSVLTKYAHVTPADIPHRSALTPHKNTLAGTESDNEVFAKVAAMKDALSNKSTERKEEEDGDDGDEDGDHDVSRRESMDNMPSPSYKGAAAAAAAGGSIFATDGKSREQFGARSRGRSFDDVENISQDLGINHEHEHEDDDDDDDGNVSPRRLNRSGTIHDGPPLEFVEEEDYSEDLGGLDTDQSRGGGGIMAHHRVSFSSRERGRSIRSSTAESLARENEMHDDEHKYEDNDDGDESQFSFSGRARTATINEGPPLEFSEDF